MTPQELPSVTPPAAPAVAGARATSRRRRRRLAALAVAGVVFVVLWWVVVGFDRITQQNYTRIEQGMTFQQVSAILGSRGDHEFLKWSELDQSEVVCWKKPDAKGRLPPVFRRDFWVSEKNVIGVEFDRSGGVVAKSFKARNPNRPSDWSLRTEKFWQELREKRHWRPWSSDPDGGRGP
jgi:hypothetical protein